MAGRHLKIAVSDTVYWAVIAYAAERGCSAAAIFNELVSEALAMRVGRKGPFILSADPAIREITAAAAFEDMGVEEFEEHLKAIGWMVWVEDRIEHANAS